MSPDPVNDDAERAREALERVCSEAALDAAARYYSPSFVDHVNGRDFHGLEGAEQSVAMYRRLIENMSIRVEQQVVDGDLVTSRFTVSGSIYGKHVAFGGITISRFENGKIVEDWSVTDTVSMLHQIGLLRSTPAPDAQAKNWLRHASRSAKWKRAEVRASRFAASFQPFDS